MAALDRVISRDVAKAELVHRPADQHEDSRPEQDLPEQAVFFGAAGAEHLLLAKVPSLHVMLRMAALPAAIRHQNGGMCQDPHCRVQGPVL